MFYEGVIYRPPSEAASLILQVTVGCRHNQCTFCSMYKGKPFRIKSHKEIAEIIATSAAQSPQTRRIFLADGDALTLDTLLLAEILHELYESFPHLQRVGIYGGPKDILAKSPEELALLKQAGLGFVYMGVESGSAEVLKRIRKGVTPEKMIIAGQRVVKSGLLLSCTVILGLGGKELSLEHARETASVLNAIDPPYLAALTLMLEPEAPLSRWVETHRFQMLTPWESLQELQTMIAHLQVGNCTFRSNHASNYLPLRAHLPSEQGALLKTLTDVIERNRQELLRPEAWRGL